MMFTHTADGPQPHTWHNPAGPVISATSRHKPVNQARPHSYPLCIEPKSEPYEYSFRTRTPPRGWSGVDGSNAALLAGNDRVACAIGNGGGHRDSQEGHVTARNVDGRVAAAEDAPIFVCPYVAHCSPRARIPSELGPRHVHGTWRTAGQAAKGKRARRGPLRSNSNQSWRPSDAAHRCNQRPFEAIGGNHRPSVAKCGGHHWQSKANRL